MDSKGLMNRTNGRFNSVMRNDEIYKENLRLLSNISAIMTRDNDDYQERLQVRPIATGFKSQRSFRSQSIGGAQSQNSYNFLKEIGNK